MLKSTLKTLDGVDDAIKPFYKEVDGEFSLQVSGMVSQADVDALKQGLVDAKEAFTELKTKNANVTEKLVRKEKALEKLEAGKKGGDDGEHEAIVSQLKAEYEAKLTQAETTVKDLRMSTVKSTFQVALGEVGFHPEVIADIAAGASTRITLDADGKPRIMSVEGNPLAGSGGDGYATMGDLAKELAAAKPSFLVDQGKGGGGKPPASRNGKSPHQSMTTQAFDQLSPKDQASAMDGGLTLIE